MGSVAEWKARFWRHSNGGIEDMTFAAGAATEAQPALARDLFRRCSEVMAGPEGKVQIFQVTSQTPPDFEVVNSNSDIFCIDVHEFGADSAYAWVSVRQKVATERYGAPASIVVLGNIKELTPDELRKISRNIEPAGAIFRPWPAECQSFDEAFSDFAESIAEVYRWPMVATG